MSSLKKYSEAKQIYRKFIYPEHHSTNSINLKHVYTILYTYKLYISDKFDNIDNICISDT